MGMAYKDTVQQLYIAYYGRPGDPGGLAYWSGELDANGGNLSAIMDSFGNSDEFTERFGDLSTRALVNNLYQQNFGRDADEAGLTYYAEEVEAGRVSLVSLATSITDGAQNEDRQTLENRIEVANAVTESVEREGLDYEAEDIEDAGEVIANVTASTEVESYKSAAVPLMEHQDTVQQVYIAYYGRPADPGGLRYWSGELYEKGGNLNAIMEQFGSSEEFTERFGELSTRELVNNLYQQNFGRDADPDGLDFWVDEISAGRETLISLATSIAQGAKNADKQALDNRIDVANSITDSVEREGLGYQAADIEAAGEAVKAVSADTDVDTYKDDTVAELVESIPTLETANQINALYRSAENDLFQKVPNSDLLESIENRQILKSQGFNEPGIIHSTYRVISENITNRPNYFLDNGDYIKVTLSHPSEASFRIYLYDSDGSYETELTQSGPLQNGSRYFGEPANMISAGDFISVVKLKENSFSPNYALDVITTYPSGEKPPSVIQETRFADSRLFGNRTEEMSTRIGEYGSELALLDEDGAFLYTQSQNDVDALIVNGIKPGDYRLSFSPTSFDSFQSVQGEIIDDRDRYNETIFFDNSKLLNESEIEDPNLVSTVFSLEDENAVITLSTSVDQYNSDQHADFSEFYELKLIPATGEYSDDIPLF